MEICNECGNQYTPPVTVPQPTPDYMCAHCAKQMTKEEADNTPWPYNPNAPHSTQGA
jgi:DNA-directed RNA polymerase subunit RPC12/RpoP